VPSPDPVRTGRGTPARRHVLACVTAALGVYLARLEARSWRAYSTAPTSDPRLAVMVACSNALYTAYRALLVLVLAVLGTRQYRTQQRENHHV
jgi:hypothetical protein